MGRDNPLGPAGWAEVMGALEHVTTLTELNGFGKYREVVAGGVVGLDIGGTQLALALSPFLHRSSETLISLDVRY